MASKIVQFPGEWIGLINLGNFISVGNLHGRCSNTLDDAFLKLISILVDGVAFPIITKEKDDKAT